MWWDPSRLTLTRAKGGASLGLKISTAFGHCTGNTSTGGCYVFRRKAGKGFTPGYVGKATKSLGQEVFAFHKLNRYQEFLVQYGKGTPLLFFILAPVKKGKPNDSQIGKVEKYLINMALTANPGLLNQQYTKSENWGIRGVVRGGKGNIAKGTISFRQMMGIR
jgi:hypothetical protein